MIPLTDDDNCQLDDDLRSIPAAVSPLSPDSVNSDRIQAVLEALNNLTPEEQKAIGDLLGKDDAMPDDSEP